MTDIIMVGKKIRAVTGSDGVKEMRLMSVITLSLKIIRGGTPLIDRSVRVIVKAWRGWSLVGEGSLGSISLA